MRIVAEPLTAEAFKPFGAVLEGTPAPGRAYLSDTLANRRAHAPVSLAVATVEPKATFPLDVKVLERHEHSSQTFIPLRVSRYLVLATLDAPGGGRMVLMPFYIWQQATTLFNWPFAATISMVLLVSVLAVVTTLNALGRRTRALAAG